MTLAGFESEVYFQAVRSYSATALVVRVFARCICYWTAMGLRLSNRLHIHQAPAWREESAVSAVHRCILGLQLLAFVYPALHRSACALSLRAVYPLPLPSYVGPRLTSENVAGVQCPHVSAHPDDLPMAVEGTYSPARLLHSWRFDSFPAAGYLADVIEAAQRRCQPGIQAAFRVQRPLEASESSSNTFSGLPLSLTAYRCRTATPP